MANEEQLRILKQGVKVWNKWRRKNYRIKIDLRKENLSGIELFEANLSEADLSNTNLSGAYLGGANLRGAILRRANLYYADFSGADFAGADLNQGDLTEAVLLDAVISFANLNGVSLKEAVFGYTLFGSTDLSKAIGLEDVYHSYPSIIGIDTLQKSKGKIPAEFLRGCGLSDWEIESVKLYNPDLTNDEFIDIQNNIFDLRNRQAIQISSLFISYSHADSQFVDRIGVFLNKKGVRFWSDIHDAKAGRLEKQIDRAMRLNPTVLLILSEHSLQSDWVEHEVRTARALEKEIKRDVLRPIALDDSWINSPWSKRIMEQVMEYNILDFSAWKDNSKFENVFNKLIDGLELFYK